jgi:predicted transposase/invertase (TIGR01784 family)
MAVESVHDKFFKAVFSRREIAVALIEELLPEAVGAALQLDALELSNASFVDEDLAEHFADLVYDTRTTGGDAVRVALLLEHKSYVVPQPHVQLLRYVLNAWKEDLQQAQPLRLLIPVVVYHGSAAWTYQPLTSYLGGVPEALARFVPEFDYLLVNLSALPEDRLLAFRNAFLGLSAFLLKHSRQQRYLEEFFEPFRQLMLAVERRQPPEVLGMVFRYVYETGDLSVTELVFIFEKISRQTSDAVMTTAERLLQQGRQEGRQEGQVEGRREATLRYIRGMLRIGMNAETIAAAFELPLAEVKAYIAQLKDE